MNPSLLTQTNVVDVMSIICTGVGAALTVTPSREITTFGEIAWDECDCGQLAVTLKRLFPSSLFPIDQAAERANCSHAYIIAELSVSIVRCVPGFTEDGEPPTPDDLKDALLLAASDAYLVRTTTQCILQGMYDAAPQTIADFLIGSQAVVGPLGGCAGTDLTVLVAWFMPCC